MAFEYGESYYGLRSWGSSAGDVKDASATVTATSGANDVDWIVAFGSGAIPMTVTSSATCSGEVVLIESTDSRLYGDWLYGVGSFDGDDALQTIVSATSTVTCSAERIGLFPDSTINVTSTVTASARRVPEGSALVNGVSTTSITTNSNGTRIREVSATPNVAATISAIGVRHRTGGQLTVAATASMTSVGEFIVAGSIQLGASVTVAAVCNRVRFGSGTPTANASITVLGFATRGGIASLTGTATSVSDSEKIFQGHIVLQPSSSILATCNRVQRMGGALSSESSITTLGREKWEIITNDSVTWTQIAA